MRSSCRRHRLDGDLVALRAELAKSGHALVHCSWALNVDDIPAERGGVEPVTLTRPQNWCSSLPPSTRFIQYSGSTKNFPTSTGCRLTAAIAMIANSSSSRGSPDVITAGRLRSVSCACSRDRRTSYVCIARLAVRRVRSDNPGIR